MNFVLKSLCEELLAILDYQARIEKSDDPELIKLLSHIRDDEKEHVALLADTARAGNGRGWGGGNGGEGGGYGSFGSGS